MSKQPRNYITLILGAGCSAPYGFPDGEKLITQMINCASNLVSRWVNDGTSLRPTDEANFLVRCFRDFENRHLNVTEISAIAQRISDELALYRPTSIDSYLGNLYNDQSKENELYIDICKYLIARVIVSAHKDHFGDCGKKEDHWAHYLFNAILYELHRNDYNIQELQIKIITFNYDTLLEQKFRNWVIKSNLLKSDKAKEAVIAVFCKSIIHVYGQIGYVALNKDKPERCNPIHAPEDSHSCETIWSNYENYNIRPDYRKNELAFHARKRIRIIGDNERHNEADLETAKDWLSKTKTLIISGYAFDQENNIRLDLEKLLSEIPEIYGTFFDAGIALKENVHSLIRQVQPLHGHPNSERKIYFDGIWQESNNLRNGFFAKFYNQTTQSFLRKELDLNRLCRSV